ncbi:MAG: hypothetical protein HY075_10055, partial [Deltaproteobacteria bacterium]|nr:hypothetical protein [Deltaproteobacteria bacterium]
MGKMLYAAIVAGFLCSFSLAFGHQASFETVARNPNWVRLKAADKFERSKIADLGISIESVTSDSVYGLVSDELLAKLRKSGVPILETFKVSSPVSGTDFPSDDMRFHNYARMTQALDELVATYPNLLKKFSIGKTLQGRDIWGVQVNSSAAARATLGDDTFSAKPGIVFMGNHHAREHVSAEIPLMLLEHLAKNYGVDKDLTALIDKRDIYVIPMVNPDGVEYDISTGSYKWQRKNMRPNPDGGSSYGVDLNRNYGF